MSDQDDKPQDLSGRNPRKRQYPQETVPIGDEDTDEDDEEELEDDFDEDNQNSAVSAAAALNQMTNLLPPAFQVMIISYITGIRYIIPLYHNVNRNS